jgi:hypothetical protein
MPKFENWSNTGDGEWEFDEKIIIAGERLKPVVHVWKWGASANAPSDYFAELYFPGGSSAEEYSEEIDHNGEVSHYTQPESNIEDAKQNARKFMKDVSSGDGIREAANAPMIEDIPEGWELTEGDNSYVLFSDEDDWDHSVVIDQISTLSNHINAGKWQLKIRRGDEVVEDDQNLEDFDKALEEAKHYMRSN